MKPGPGEIVALFLEKYNERPQIGRVKTVDREREKLMIEWYDGGWTTKWKLYEYKEGRKKVIWTEEVDLKDLIFMNIVFTASCRLPANIVRQY